MGRDIISALQSNATPRVPQPQPHVSEHVNNSHHPDQPISHSTTGLKLAHSVPGVPKTPHEIFAAAKPDELLRNLPLSCADLNLLLPALAKEDPFVEEDVSQAFLTVSAACQLNREAKTRERTASSSRQSSISHIRETERLILQPIEYPPFTEILTEVSSLHASRFTRWPTAPSTEMWRRHAREVGRQPAVVSYDLAHLSLGDQVSFQAWREAHDFTSLNHSVILYTAANAQRAASNALFRGDDKIPELRDCDNLADLREALFLMGVIRRRVWPFDVSIESLQFFLLKNNYLQSYALTERSRTSLCAAFIDYTMRLNAANYSRLQPPLDNRALQQELQTFIESRRTPSQAETVAHRPPPQTSRPQPQRVLRLGSYDFKSDLCMRYNSAKGCPEPYKSSTNQCDTNGVKRFHCCSYTIDGTRTVCRGLHRRIDHNALEQRRPPSSSQPVATNSRT